ncbi:CaiB/BaiF CoA-transferase family protein [Kineosporia sp. A_224]|uniref:CaiB/BaiF CoA transferase family protein n=1 Tax=Kineosporia sp. A_224 TaxID=1962180 RepID=UPI000B4C14A5|nr:CaiB/BaiF CoA-transferase family protein [Kineosporia sp. A_224]
MLPLAGITVVACEQAVAAPFATRQLADLGARVIKVERPGRGDFARDYDATVHGQSSHFVWLNRSKESVVLDLKDDADRARLLGLVDTADVFVENLAPGAAARLGLGEALRETRPRLVTCSVSGYGTGGDLEHAKAYDALIQAEAGTISVTGTPADPAKAGIPVADIAGGTAAFSGILAALLHRERTGVGTHVAVSLFDALVEWMGHPMYYALYGGTPPPRAGTSHAAIAPYGIFAAGDGTAFMLSVQNEREWADFCTHVLGDGSVAADARFAGVAARVAHRDALHTTIDTVLRTLDGPWLERRLRAGRIAYSHVRGVEDLRTHPQLAQRDRWRVVRTPGGPVDALLPAIGLTGLTPRMDPVPALGEHQALVADDGG